MSPLHRGQYKYYVSTGLSYWGHALEVERSAYMVLLSFGR